MENVYNINGLVFWNEEEILLRNHYKNLFSVNIKQILININSAWKFIEIESSLLTPSCLINASYTNDDVWFQKDDSLVLRPETTPGSYAYATFLLENQKGVKPPFCVWQSGKSFRHEQDQVTKNMRLKEFYQQEFQCIFTSDTGCDYHSEVLEPIKAMFEKCLKLPTRIVPSDRLPDYSEITSDVEIDNGDKWMELCSISRRKDFKTKAKMQSKSILVEKELKVLEIAIGLDRCVYNSLK